MLVLGIDTATRRGSVGVVAFEGRAAGAGAGADSPARISILAERFSDAALQHGETLLALIDDCLGRAAVGLEAIDAIAVSIGPGSFTGLRVGLATAKGLVLGTPTGLVGVPTLTALAASLIGRMSAPGEVAPNEARRRLVCPCLDARRGEVYGALFATDERARSAAEPGSVERLLDDTVCTPEELAAALGAVAATASGPTAALTLLGDGADRHAARLHELLGPETCILPFADYPPRGAVVAALGARALTERGADDPAGLAPRYARVSDAERVRAARAASGATREARR